MDEHTFPPTGFAVAMIGYTLQKKNLKRPRGIQGTTDMSYYVNYCWAFSGSSTNTDILVVLGKETLKKTISETLKKNLKRPRGIQGTSDMSYYVNYCWAFSGSLLSTNTDILVVLGKETDVKENYTETLKKHTTKLKCLNLCQVSKVLFNVVGLPVYFYLKKGVTLKYV